MNIVEGEQVKKVRNEFNVEDLISLKKNAKTKHILICSLCPDKYNNISNCLTGNQIWDALVNAYEGTCQVRKFRVVLLFTKYKAFKTKGNESLQNIIS